MLVVVKMEDSSPTLEENFGEAMRNDPGTSFPSVRMSNTDIDDSRIVHRSHQRLLESPDDQTYDSYRSWSVALSKFKTKYW